MRLTLLPLLLLAAMPAFAATPRETLVNAAFVATDKDAAVAQVSQAEEIAVAQLGREPNDREAALQRALAIGYRAQLKRALGDAKTARKLFEALATAAPNDPEVLLALAGWHLEAIADVGGMLAGTMLGAKRATGLAYLDRAVAANRDRQAFIYAYAALIRIRLMPNDLLRSRQLAEAAAAAAAPTPLDKIMQRSARALLVPLKAGDGKAAAALAERLLPFGKLKG